MLGIITNPIFLWIFWIVVGLLVTGFLFWIVVCFVASYYVYNKTLRRPGKESWSRNVPANVDPDQVPMYELGFVWARENAEYKKDVHIVNNGANLYGEYYDFGKSRCAVILSGRTESLIYGYYFAIPYAKCDCNILVLDPRGHGLSDGEFNTVGFEESKDTIAWVNHIRETYGIESFIFHGICIGAANGMLALASPNCPDCIDAIITEGMFPNFSESVKNHMIEQKKPRKLTLRLVDFWMKHYTGHSMRRGPINVIENVHVPLLMLHSKEDLYSTPEYAQKLYDLSGAESKKLVWFDHGRHSMLRITDTERYDASITEFLSELPVKETKKEEEIADVL